ncbi:hypothetical protein ES702_05553 [subsurface metagenome]
MLFYCCFSFLYFTPPLPSLYFRLASRQNCLSSSPCLGIIQIYVLFHVSCEHFCICIFPYMFISVVGSLSVIVEWSGCFLKVSFLAGICCFLDILYMSLDI